MTWIARGCRPQELLPPWGDSRAGGRWMPPRYFKLERAAVARVAEQHATVQSVGHEDAGGLPAEGADAGLVDHGRIRAVAERLDRSRARARDRGFHPQAAVALLGHVRARSDGAVEEGRGGGRIERDAARRAGEAGDGAVVPGVGRMVGGLRRDDGPRVADDRGLVRGDPRAEQARYGDGGDDPDDGHDDQELDEGESPLTHHSPLSPDDLKSANH